MSRRVLAAGRVRAAVVGVRAAYGVLLLLVPASVLPPGSRDRPGLVVARLLGARHLGQGLAAALAPGLATPERSALVDATHGVSMIGWAALDRRHRRQALLSTASAALFVIAERATARPHETDD